MKSLLKAGALAALLFAVPAFASPNYKATLTVNGYRGGSTLTDFPVLVRISPERIAGFQYSQCEADGSDISFANDKGQTLPHEIDTWDPEGESLVWVKVPSFNGETSFDFRWNDPEPAAFDAAQTWNANYVGVWHLGEEDGVCANSSQCGSKYDATPGGGLDENYRYADGAAPVGGARQIAKSKKLSYLEVPNYDAENVGNVFTISTWVRVTAQGNWSRLFVRKPTDSESGGWELIFSFEGDNWKRYYVRGANSASQFGDYIASPAYAWVHVSIVYNGPAASLYCNGGLQASGAITPATDNGRPLYLGALPQSWAAWGVSLDECRLMKGAADPDWIQAEYDTVNNQTFLSYGALRPATTSAFIVEDPKQIVTRSDSLDLSLDVRGFGDQAEFAAMTVLYGESADALTSSVSPAAIYEVGTITATLPNLAPAHDYYAQTIVSNSLGAVVTSAVFKVSTLRERTTTLTANGYTGTTTLTNFPVLVRISSDTIQDFDYV